MLLFQCYWRNKATWQYKEKLDIAIMQCVIKLYFRIVINNQFGMLFATCTHVRTCVPSLPFCPLRDSKAILAYPLRDPL